MSFMDKITEAINDAKNKAQQAVNPDAPEQAAPQGAPEQGLPAQTAPEQVPAQPAGGQLGGDITVDQSAAQAEAEARIAEANKRAQEAEARAAEATKHAQEAEAREAAAAKAATPAPAPQAPTHKTYTVKPGDSFWRIAKQQMGDGERYEELAKANGMTSTSVIHPGDTLIIPQ